MAYIDDVRVNGQLTSTEPVVSLPVVIGWDFVEDEAAYGQASYELQIGTSDFGLGTDSFTGDISDTFEMSTGNFYEHKPHNLSRGTTYYAQIKATDPDGDTTLWSTFSFSINKLPFVSNYFLSPTSPTQADDLELNYTYHDLDSHDESGTKIRWYKNNLPMSQYDNTCILPNTALSVGDSWTAKIIPSDGLEFGPIVDTASVTVASSDISAFNIVISPLYPNVDDILKVEFDISENEYISNVAAIISWYKNNVLVPDSNNEFIRLSLDPGDIVKAVIELTDGERSFGEFHSSEKTITDVEWHVYDVEIDELDNPINLTNLTPIVEWSIHKTTAEANELPNYFRVLITKTQSLDGAVYDTGFIEYTKNSYIIPSDILSRGQGYFIHVGVSDDTDLDPDQYVSKKLEMAGSSWSENVSNEDGWTIEFKVSVKENGTNAPAPEDNEDTIYPKMGVYIHDGSYFCAIILEQKHITFVSDESVIYTLPTSEPDLTTAKTFKISGQGQSVKVFINNSLAINAIGMLTNTSLLKQIEYGDLDGKYTNEGTFRFFRYSTDGAFGFSGSLPDENTFYFHSLGQLKDGQIQYILDNLVSVLPDDTTKSAKLVQFNENSNEAILPTVTRNFSPITSIYIDKNRNKYIGTANGVTAIYGEKHDPDYEFLTDDSDVSITPSDFDRITTVQTDQLASVEPDLKSGWLTIDTTYRSIGETSTTDGFETGDPYDPYRYALQSHAIHYYSQRTHGHAWYDQVDNAKGWQITFAFQLEKLEQDDYQDQNIQHQGFGFYINDGTRQEILHFYEDRIVLFHANVYVPIVTGIARDYRIVGKENNLLIYQKINSAPTSAYQLLFNGNGLFTTEANLAGNSNSPKIVFDSFGIYHAVWHDDGNSRSQILYSSFDGNSWSNPETVIQSTQFSLKNPVISVDSLGRVWVAYEDTSWGKTEISVSTRDSVGWNPKVRITNYASNKQHPAICIDTVNNVHVVWEDDRNGNYQIFWAQRLHSRQAWVSSSQFGEDTVVMQQNNGNDEYSSGAMSFRNPQLAYMHPKVWLVAEGLNEETQKSVIYRGFRDINNNYWNSIGSVVLNDDDEFVGLGQSYISTQEERNCVNPSISTNPSEDLLIIAWEDQTDDLFQIWASVYSNNSVEIIEPTKLTDQDTSCKYPSVGFVNRQAIIAFETASQIYTACYNSVTNSFTGSGTGGSDTLVNTDGNKNVSKPSLAPFVQSRDTKVVYSFYRERDGSLQTLELPDYFQIGSSSISHQELDGSGTTTTTSTLSDVLISNIDTKEFAFGDISENIGILAHWKDIKMYFGYDARPQSISKFSQSNVLNFPDNRVNDIFVDVFGNLVIATFGGLCYHNVFTGQLVNIDGHTDDQECSETNCVLKGKLVTCVKWGTNGAWFVGTNEGIYLTTSAGKLWSRFDTPSVVVYSIGINKQGKAVCGTSNGIYVVEPDTTKPIINVSILNTLPSTQNNVKVIAVDDNNIIWAGTDYGLIRVENLSSFIVFNRKNGMSASHVSSIAIVNKYVRFIGTPSGINRMNGTRFSKINVHTHEILNNNIASLQWVEETKSLWVGSLYSLHEIVFRDPAHEIIDDEVTQYTDEEISTEQDYDKSTYFILDTEEIQQDPLNPLVLSQESATALINKNPIYFGYTVDVSGGSIKFACDLLTNDEVEVKISNRFIEFHSFEQSDIEKRVVGTKRTNIKKLVRTFFKNQLLALSELDKNQILLYAGENSVPYTTVMLDRDLPIGCIQKIDTLTSTKIKFKILAYDNLSGLDGYILSNYENFTSDGELPLDYQELPSDGVVTHDIGAGLNNVTTSFTFPSTVTGNDQEFEVGDGSCLGTWTDTSENITYLYAGTNNPPTIWKFDPGTEEWEGIQILDDDDEREITQMFTFNNVLYVATGTTLSGDKGVLYKTSDGQLFQVAAVSVDGTYINAITASLDGTVYFGDNSGDIYEYKNNVATRIYTDIGNAIYSMDVWKDYLLVGTGNQGKIYLVNIATDNNIIVFDGNETHISKLHIKDALFSLAPETTYVYAASGEFTNIYRANLGSFDFIKSYSSFGKTINKLTTVDRRVLQSTLADNEEITQTIACVGDSLFKHRRPTWEFFYRHDEEIKDVIQFGTGTQGLYVISASKVTKWTSQLVDKTVYLRLKDKAGNVSVTPVTDPACPIASDDEFCCNYAYSINIQDLASFVSDNRITNISEYGEIQFTMQSPNGASIYSADQIDQEIGVYVGEVLNGSNNLVSWSSIAWEGTEPEGTSIDVQIRSGTTETELEESAWSENLTKGGDGLVDINFITDQYLQFRVILISQSRGISPSLTQVTIKSITTQASHFFTTNFVLNSPVKKGIISANIFTPVNSEVVFGINTNNSVSFSDYQIIENNRLFSTSANQFGNNLRIGARLLSPRSISDDPYNPYSGYEYGQPKIWNFGVLFELENGEVVKLALT